MNISSVPAVRKTLAFSAQEHAHQISGAMTGIERIARSAAYAAECPIAVFCERKVDDFEVSATFGVTTLEDDFLAWRPIAKEALLQADGLLIVNDMAARPGSAYAIAWSDPEDGPAVRFIAAVPVVDNLGEIFGVLMVADVSPHAGLSAAKIYVLRSHAVQISAQLELNLLHEKQGQGQLSKIQQAKTERLRLLESVVVNANDAVLITEAEPFDLPGPRIVYCNAAFTRTTGYSESEVLGRTPRILQSARTDRTTLDKLRVALTRWEPIEVELLNSKKDGTHFCVELSIVPVANEDGWFTHWVSVQRDVSDRKTAEETATRARIAEAENEALESEIQERKRVEAKLLYTAFHDDLTKLRNRAFLMDRLTLALSRAKLEPAFKCAVLFMDLDRFKLVNDSLGHRAGDLLLMEVARRLQACVRPQDTLARVGGDEFALLIEGIDSGTAVLQVAVRIIETMRRPLWLGKQEVFSNCSLGVVYANDQHKLPEELLRDADIAMYQAKRNDVGGYAIFAAGMHESAVAALGLRTDLQNALGRDEFFLNYQPICNAGTRKIIGVEALIRWRHPTRGLVPPVAFIATAEESGLIREIGRWVLREACLQMRHWRVRFPDLRLRLSVNASGKELKDRHFASEVGNILSSTGLDPRSLQIEVTEGIFLQHPESTSKILSSLRDLGIRIALDDFGTGYSSLSYLDRYQMDTIKIDQSFVLRMLTEPRTLAIVATIVQLGQVLDLDIVGEGIEDDAQLQALVRVGCSSAQGYLLGRPMSAADLELALANQIS